VTSYINLDHYIVRLIVLNTDPCAVGKPVELTTSTGNIRSPGYDKNRYPNYADCQWLITAPSGIVGLVIIVKRRV